MQILTCTPPPPRSVPRPLDRRGNPCSLHQGHRLNLLPVKTVVNRTGKNINTTSTKCKTQPESLGQVLNACTANTGLTRERHNKVLEKPKRGNELIRGAGNLSRPPAPRHTIPLSSQHATMHPQTCNPAEEENVTFAGKALLAARKKKLRKKTCQLASWILWRMPNKERNP